jgi:signal transduction histidine kinase
MQGSTYLRLIYLTAGTLLPFFWMIVILGHRRKRNLERIFFFLCLALVCFFGGGLLALNSRIYYGTPPVALSAFAWAVVCLGLWFIAPLLVHLHVEYASLRKLIGTRTSKVIWIVAAYGPALLLSPILLEAWRLRQGIRFEAPSHQLGIEFQVWLVLAICVATYWQWKFSQAPRDQEERKLFRAWRVDFILLAVLLPAFFVAQQQNGGWALATLEPLLALAVLMPFITMIREVQRFNFLDIGRQRNLVYAVFMVFLAVLYLSLVRRASLWLEPYLPPEATAALLLFLPVVFFEPLQRLLRRSLRQTAQTEVDRAQKLMGPINAAARLGYQRKLRKFSEEWIAGQLQLAEARIELDGAVDAPRAEAVADGGTLDSFEIRRGTEHLGRLKVRTHGAMMSGETYAALEFLCEQLPAAFDLCRLIEEKLQLERELAERERLALVGQMAASISHNLKNPLGSIKTILQVQMESPELPESMRAETKMVLQEVNRLSSKLNQLLQFSRPAILGTATEGSCDIREVIASVLNVLRPEAERKGVRLGSRMVDGESKVDASAEALHDVISNLVVNAIDASPSGGEVKVQLSWQGLPCVVSVEDEGNGIPADLQEKVLQPFFTTKPQGTGLGLAVVVKRVTELGGELKIVSPLSDGRGTRFEVKLWPAAVRRGKARVETQSREF